MSKPLLVLFFILCISLHCHTLINSQETNSTPTVAKIQTETTSNYDRKPLDNETVYRVSKQLCWGCIGESIQFLFAHNLVRARKWELPLAWDTQLEGYARWWAGQRKLDCKLQHSFPEGQFRLGENIFWGSGSAWTPIDAVNAWTDEEKYYTYATNRCAEGQMCGHYTQIVWWSTRRMGCARAVCDNGDVFMTCNYDPPGNYVGERPY
ncbi:Ves allergen [Parasponia andersonii]|uniref:Ves allergen n=1 Tax=Parasponia andersonii TaxID=3476 RepID=A0A2P5C739_PARAD|nr:Ves allergen [Parasponia andersonii]